ncbi:MAG: DUF1127 domain-containing protein [Alphaproteobacteria bacterium]
MLATRLRPFDSRPRFGRRSMTLDLLGDAARRILYTLRLWRERVHARNDLARLDERALADIGLTHADRDFLVNKPFWRE